MRIVASIEEPTAIRANLAHFALYGALEQAHYQPAARAPPAADVTTCRPRDRGRKLEDATMRPRPRRAALGPPPGIGEKCPRTAPLRRPAKPKPHAPTTHPSLNRRLRGRRLPARLPENGV
jgi:hypothetical protein